MTTLAATHQDSSLLWFWTEGAWSTSEFVSFLTAIDYAFSLIGALDWAAYISTMQGADPGIQSEAQTLVDYLGAPVAEAVNSRRPHPRTGQPPFDPELWFLRHLQLELRDLRITPRAVPTLTSGRLVLQRARGLPQFRIASISMASPGVISFRGAASIIRQLRLLIKDLAFRNRQEEEAGELALATARVFLQERLGAAKLDPHSNATYELATSFEIIKRLGSNGHLVDVARSMALDEPIERE